MLKQQIPAVDGFAEPKSVEDMTDAELDNESTKAAVQACVLTVVRGTKETMQPLSNDLHAIS